MTCCKSFNRFSIEMFRLVLNRGFIPACDKKSVASVYYLKAEQKLPFPCGLIISHSPAWCMWLSASRAAALWLAAVLWWRRHTTHAEEKLASVNADKHTAWPQGNAHGEPLPSHLSALLPLPLHTHLVSRAADDLSLRVKVSWRLPTLINWSFNPHNGVKYIRVNVSEAMSRIKTLTLN